jgi:putative membrane protein
VTLFAVGSVAFYTKPLRFLLVPAAILKEHAGRLARLQFAALVHDRTPGDVGLLLFVSLAERHVEILVDRGISDRIPTATWQKIVDDFVEKVRAGRTTEGIIGAIESGTTILAQHFPPIPGAPGAISDRLTEL